MKNQIEAATVEITDTFGGEANYSWVKRKVVGARTERGLVRVAKKAMGWENIRCRRQDMGDTIALYPAGICQVMFIYK